MGLFSKKKENHDVAPPMPPAPPSSSENKEVSAPTPGMQKLSAPPMPGGTLDDIKNQVSTKPAIEENMQETSSFEPTQVQDDEPDLSIQESTNIQSEDLSDVKTTKEDDDSLFDFSELDLESPTMHSDENDESIGFEHSFESTSNEDSRLTHEEKSHLSFIDSHESNKRKSHHMENFFITTKQFKSLLEIIESVKLKVKDASETHLKLLDIKTEEDIEYDNLRKDFQFIEDKLHEVDSLIFDN